MRYLILLGVIIVLAAPAAYSQPMTSKVEIGVSGGLNMPTGDLGDGTKTGYAFGANVGFRATPMFTIGGEIMYYGNGATDDVLSALGADADMSMSILQYTAMAKFMVPVMNTHNAYAKAVAGAYNATSKFSNLPIVGSGEVSDTNLGFGVGGGFRINGEKMYSLYAEGMYHHINGEAASAQFFSVSAGVLFSLP